MKFESFLTILLGFTPASFLVPFSAPALLYAQGRPERGGPAFERMWPDGICRVTGCYCCYYTKTIQFQDINYQLL